MKRKLLFLVVVAVAVFAACDPFGTSETRAYITGRIFADSLMTVPFEGATVLVEVDPDSIAMPTISAVTNANGVFMLEVPFFTSSPDDGMSGYGMSGVGRVGLKAYALGLEYVYRSYNESPFVVTAGDTLVVWDVPVTSFKEPE